MKRSVEMRIESVSVQPTCGTLVLSMRDDVRRAESEGGAGWVEASSLRVPAAIAANFVGSIGLWVSVTISDEGDL